MNDTGARERILANAVRLFSQQGFHGTSMRDIAAVSGCSLPTLYYHYKSKGDLFEEIVVNQFLMITDRMNRSLDLKASPEALYFQVVQSRKALAGFDRAVYKMALKVWLGFEGEDKAREQVLDWERRRVEANRGLVARAVVNERVREDVTEILINYMENVINRIILLEEDIDDEKLRRQIALLFHIGE